MTCEMAEDFLSAYLDDMLDAQENHDLEQHLESCVNCRDVLADYRRFDLALAVAPRVEPSEALHARIFESPEFAAIVGKRQKHERAASTDVRGSVHIPARGRRSPPSWSRVALQSAAVVVLVLGSALLVRQGLLHFSAQTSQTSTPPIIGNPGQTGVPLAAGPRAIYQRNGALWSAPEDGPGLAQQLTPNSVQVAGWSVSADGHMLAYIDAQTGRIHTVRSDGQSDAVIGSAGHVVSGGWNTFVGQAVADGLAWSPNGAQIAYVGVDPSGQIALYVMNADGSDTHMISAGLAAPVWSGDSQWIAYNTLSVRGIAQGVGVYDVVTQSARVVSAQADPSHAQATIKHVYWLSDMAHPAVTWAAQEGAAVTGIFTAMVAQSAGVQRLTPTGVSFTVVDFTERLNGGAWVATDPAVGTLVTLSAHTGATLATVKVSSDVQRLIWSPDGKVAVVATDGALGVWTTGGTLASLAGGVVGTPVWSADSHWLAFVTNAGVVSVELDGATAQATYHLMGATGAATLQWAQDGRSILIAGVAHVQIVARDGAQTKVVDMQAAQGAQIEWSQAG